MNLNNESRIHFIGIGGVGMSAIAWILLKMGYKISGSDLSENRMTKRLKENGADIFSQHTEENVKQANLIVISSAIKKTNPELKYALENNIEVVHRSDILAWILAKSDAITIAGTHGKTTTTSMTSFVFEHAGLEPIILIGGEVNDFGGNAKFGSGRYAIAEADESDGTFVKYFPMYSIITNIEADHLDHYGDFSNIKKAFKQFISQTKPDGKAFVCLDDPTIREMLPEMKCSVKTYSINDKNADIHAENIEIFFGGSSYEYIIDGKKLGKITLSVPGKHNVANSLAAIGVALECGIPFEKIPDIIRNFKGAGRRFEVKGRAKGITIIDDYAHHPTEIAVTLKALENIPNNGRAFVVFQPHRYSRTMNHFKEFADVLSRAENLFLTDVYSAGEEPIANITGETIFNELDGCTDKPRKYIKDKNCVADEILPQLKEGDVVITIGAGDVWKIGAKVLEKLSEQSLLQ